MYCALVRYLSEENKESRELLFTRVVNDSKATKKKKLSKFIVEKHERCT